jgi:lipopolysaccharide transport system ATP-binding protein
VELVMAEDLAIALKNVSKCFKRYGKPSDRLKETLLPGKSRAEEFWALHDISLEVARGETLGVIGQNGSGKSTLLQIIAGTLTPTAGKVQVNGRVSALLELGSGFNPEFTGRQNVFFNGQILGLSQAELEAKFDHIAAFADIGDFIDQPVKTYSSGMFIRLAFAVAISVDPNILIVDEALAVGDGIFVHRCMAKIKDFQDAGGTILFVSHDVGAIARLCSQVAWINAGSVAGLGEPGQITKRYQAWIYDSINAYQKEELEQTSDAEPMVKVEDKVDVDDKNVAESMVSRKLNPYTLKNYQAFPMLSRFGTGRAEIVGFEVLDITGDSLKFVYPGDEIKVVVKTVAFDRVRSPLIGVVVYDRLRTEVTGFNTYQLKNKLPKLSAGEQLEVEFSLKWPEIQGGNYLLETAIADGSQDSNEMLDWLQCSLNLMSGVIELTFGIMRLSNIEVSYSVYQPKTLIK